MFAKRKAVPELKAMLLDIFPRMCMTLCRTQAMIREVEMVARIINGFCGKFLLDRITLLCYHNDVM